MEKKTGGDRGDIQSCSKTISYRNAERKRKTFSTVEKCQGRIHRIKRWCVCMKDIFCIQISLLRSQYFLKS